MNNIKEITIEFEDQSRLYITDLTNFSPMPNSMAESIMNLMNNWKYTTVDFRFSYILEHFEIIKTLTKYGN
jgi:hypothetical protein